jgi:hypothetical protein
MAPQRSYTIQKKRKVLGLFDAHVATLSGVSASSGVPIRSLRDWKADSAAITEYSGAQKNTSMGGQGRKEIIPFAHDLVTIIKDLRRDKEVCYNTRAGVRMKMYVVLTLNT